MPNRKTAASIALFFAALSPGISSHAGCFTVYGPSNQTLYQSQRTPVPLDTIFIDKEVQRIFPGGHLVIDESRLCPIVMPGRQHRSIVLSAEPSSEHRPRRAAGPVSGRPPIQ